MKGRWLVLGALVGFGLACGGDELLPDPEGAARDVPVTAPTGPMGVPLQSLVATSGAGVHTVVDGDAATGWTPGGDPGSEGILLRFEQPTQVQKVRVQACPGSSKARFDLYVDGSVAHESVALQADGIDKPVTPNGEAGRIRSVYVALRSGDTPCIGEISFTDGGKAVAVAPPRLVKGRVAASSVLSPDDAYHPGYLFDGRTDFGWVEGDKGAGEGESLTITFDAPTEVTALELWNGYQRSADHFQKNARASRVRVTADAGAPVSMEVADAQGPQVLMLPAPVKARKIVLEIEKVTKGTKYPDLVLSELRFHDTVGTFGLDTPDRAEQKAELEGAVRGKALGEVVDRLAESACSDGGSGRLKLRTDHSFVWYGSSSDWGSGQVVDEVFDGAWVVKKQGTPWSTVELFGRRHRTESTWQPYGESVAGAESVRIGGGALEVARVADLTAKDLDALVASWGSGPAASRVGCFEMDYGDEYRDRLAAEGAIVVKGKAITDVLVPKG